MMQPVCKSHPFRAIGKAHAMKKFATPITLALACIAYGLGVGCAFYFAAQAQGATNICNPDCLMQKMDVLNQKNQAEDFEFKPQEQ
jgi:hypothetical protein